MAEIFKTVKEQVTHLITKVDSLKVNQELFKENQEGLKKQLEGIEKFLYKGNGGQPLGTRVLFNADHVDKLSKSFEEHLEVHKSEETESKRKRWQVWMAFIGAVAVQLVGLFFALHYYIAHLISNIPK